MQAVDRYWTDKILAEAAEKSSLKYMNTQKYSIGQAQLVWCDAVVFPLASFSMAPRHALFL